MDLKQIAAEMQPKSMAARDWVFQVIRTAIIKGVLPGDMPLRQDEISQSLSVSHIPVREAFRQLEAQGLVRIHPNRGAVVTKLTRHEMENVMDTRIMLELGAMRAALPCLTSADIDKAYDYLEEFAAAKDFDIFDVTNLKLHFALYNPCDNQLLLSYIEQLHANVDRYIRPFYTEENSYPVKSIDAHKSLIDACRAKDVELATAVLRTHLETTKVMLLQSPLL